PGREEGREPGGDRREEEAEGEDGEDGGTGCEADPDADRGELLLELENRQFELEPDERADALGDGLDRAGQTAVSVASRAGVHGPASRRPLPGSSRPRLPRRARPRGSGPCALPPAG